MEATKEISLERLATGRKVELKKRGAHLVSRCPFHNENAPELVIDARANMWTCEQCAPSSGGPLEWVMRAEGVSRLHARQMIRAGVFDVREPKKRGRQTDAVPHLSTARLLPSLFDGEEADGQILEKVARYYAETLTTSEAPLAWLKERKIDERAVKALGLGYGDRTLGLRIPNATRVLGARLRARLRKLGVLRAESGHEHLYGCLVVPLSDLEGRMAQLYGRRIERQRSERGRGLWLSGPHVGLLNAKALEGAKEIVIAGSIEDALTACSCGIEQVTALDVEDEAARAMMREAIEKWGTERVTLLSRRTKQGSPALGALSQTIASMGVEVLRVVMPLRQSVHELVTSNVDGVYKLAQLVRTAEWVGGVKKKPLRAPVKAEEASTAGPAAALPAEPAARPTEPTARQGEDGLVYVFGDRRWRVRGLVENHTRGVLKVNVFVSREGVGFHVDSFDLYSSRQRTAFLKQGALELALEETVVKKDLGQVLLRLEEQQEQVLAELARPAAKKHEMTDEERKDALELLRDPKLMEHVLGGLERLGVVGERTNLAIAYLASISRKLAEPLAVVIQSSSAAVPSSMLAAVLRLVPGEDRLSFSALTGQSLYYMAPGGLRHKVLAITEESGSERATHSLKLLVSQGALKIASTAKETSTGRLVSHEYSVEGPVAIMMSTTSVRLDEEIMARSLVLAVDESAEQTRRIQEAERARTTLEGLVAREKSEPLVKVHQNAQRLLRSVRVVNPLASSMIYPDHRVRARLDQRKLLGLIEAVALLHQHQRPLQQIAEGEKVIEYIEATRDDVELAERLLREVGAIGVAEIPPQTAKLLELAMVFVRERTVERRERVSTPPVRFSRRELREAIGWGDTQLWTHLKRLVELELVVEQRAGVGRSVVYELVGMYASGSIRGSFGLDSGSIRAGDSDASSLKESMNATSAPTTAETHPGTTRAAARVGIPRAS